MSTALGVIGCSVGPDYSRPEVALPGAWTEAPPLSAGPGHASLETWWTVFEDPALNGLIHRAIASNLDLKIAAARAISSLAGPDELVPSPLHPDVHKAVIAAATDAFKREEAKAGK